MALFKDKFAKLALKTGNILSFHVCFQNMKINSYNLNDNMVIDGR